MFLNNKSRVLYSCLYELPPDGWLVLLLSINGVKKSQLPNIANILVGFYATNDMFHGLRRSKTGTLYIVLHATALLITRPSLH